VTQEIDKMLAAPVVTKIYAQITLFCNQRCPHCCYDSGPHRREFMDIEVFKASLKYEPSALFNIGGGEPTCHPQFWEMLDLAIKARGRGRVWLATNGKRKEHALKLAEMVRNGDIKACLSQDKWHEPVSQEVVDAFKKLHTDGWVKAIRNVNKGRGPIKSGRCDWGEPRCNSTLPFVQWDGKVRQCACLDAPIIGDVHFGYKSIVDSEKWKCWKGLCDG